VAPTKKDPSHLQLVKITKGKPWDGSQESEKKKAGLSTLDLQTNERKGPEKKLQKIRRFGTARPTETSKK